MKAESPQDFDFVYLFVYGANKSLLLATPACLVHRLIEPCYTGAETWDEEAGKSLCSHLRRHKRVGCNGCRQRYATLVKLLTYIKLYFLL